MCRLTDCFGFIHSRSPSWQPKSGNWHFRSRLSGAKLSHSDLKPTSLLG